MSKNVFVFPFIAVPTQHSSLITHHSSLITHYCLIQVLPIANFKVKPRARHLPITFNGIG